MNDGGRRPPQTDLGITPLARGQERPGLRLTIAVLTTSPDEDYTRAVEDRRPCRRHPERTVGGKPNTKTVFDPIAKRSKWPLIECM